ncbi:uncharacterized protein [Pseudorasbora parva]|uniref:uncharacterized protein isoform X2 n=1 Tax=Pseudorasbora parva TaxID=51549 RepID=UPI00351DEDC8
MDDRRSLSDCSDDSGSSDRSKDRPPPDPPDWSDDSGSSDRSKDRPPPDPPDCSDDSGSSDRSKDRPPPDPPDWSDDCSDYWSASEHSTDPPSFNRIIARVQSGLGRLSSSNGTKYHDTSRRDADMYVLHNLKSQMKELLEAYHRLKNVSRLIQEIVSGTQGAAQRPNLATILKETFMCLICRGVMERPVFTSCCRSVLGCKVCIDQWMENSRQCPKCRSEGVVITEVAGLSNVLEVTNSFV